MKILSGLEVIGNTPSFQNKFNLQQKKVAMKIGNKPPLSFMGPLSFHG